MLYNIQVLSTTQGVIVLIITRGVGEKLLIGDDMSVTVLGVNGNQFRIGVTVPGDVTVHREEFLPACSEEKESAEEQ